MEDELESNTTELAAAEWQQSKQHHAKQQSTSKPKTNNITEDDRDLESERERAS